MGISQESLDADKKELNKRFEKYFRLPTYIFFAIEYAKRNLFLDNPLDYIRIHELYNSVFEKMLNNSCCDIFCIYSAIDKLSKSKKKNILNFNCKTLKNSGLILSENGGYKTPNKGKNTFCVSFIKSKLEAYKELDELFNPYSIKLNIDLVEFLNKTDVIDIIKKWGNFRKKFDSCGNLGQEFKNNIANYDGPEPSYFLFPKTVSHRIIRYRKKPTGAKMIQNKDVEANLLGLFVWDNINNYYSEYLEVYKNTISDLLNTIDPKQIDNKYKENIKKIKKTYNNMEKDEEQLRTIQFNSEDMEYELKIIADCLFDYRPQAPITKKLLERTNTSIICPPPLNQT